MRIPNFSRYLFLLTPFAVLACSANVSIPGAGTAAKSAVLKPLPDDAFAGPSLDGRWQSGCLKVSKAEPMDSTANAKATDKPSFQKLGYKFKARNVTRTKETFTDESCVRISDYEVMTGRYRYAAKLKDGAYEVEYRFTAAAGSIGPSESLRLQGDALFVSSALSIEVDPTTHLQAVDSYLKPTPREPVAGSSARFSGEAAELLWSALTLTTEAAGEVERHGQLSVECQRYDTYDKFDCRAENELYLGDLETNLKAVVPLAKDRLSASGRLDVSCVRDAANAFTCVTILL